MGFQGISTALTALYANRAALDVTGNNIANVNTEGYSRQRVEQSSSSLYGTSTSFWSTGARPGVGVNVDDIKRLRDQFLENSSLDAHGNSGYANRTSKTYSSVETAFGEPSDKSIQANLSTLWGSFDDLNSAAGGDTELAARKAVAEDAQTLVSSINLAGNSLSKLNSDSLQNITADVNELNAWAQNIADLNKSIQAQTAAGQTPNELMDQRDLLIRKMSDVADVTVTATTQNSVRVSIGGVDIVNNHQMTKMQADTSGTPVKLTWDSDHNPDTPGGNPVTIKGGDLGGLMETVNSIIPKYTDQLNTLAMSLKDTVNAIHNGGVDKYGNAGGDFFVGTNATDFALNPAVYADPNLIAAGTAANGGTDGENARKFGELANSTTGVDAQYRAMVNVLGTESSRASNQSDINTTIATNADSSRDSVSGVNLDEEMTNMIQFQNAYSASAKYLSTMNDVLDTLLTIVR